MNIIVSANSKYMRYLYVMLVSLFENNREETITIYVMQRDFTDEDKRTIADLARSFGQHVEYLFVDAERFASLPTTEKFSLETYFRLIMAELLPKEVQKILYLDVDIIVRGTLRQLYETNLDQFIAGVCQDVTCPVLEENKRKLFQRTGDMRYFNAGVMLWNVMKLRKEYKLHHFLEAAKNLGYQLQYADQEILNYLLYDKVLYFSGSQYNCIARGDMKETDLTKNDPIILHYAGCNPWQNGKKNDLYQIWWRYAKKTPFYLELLEEQLWREIGFGTEKQAYILRDIELREIYENAFRLKGTGQIKKHMKYADCNIGVYGAGKMADVLYELLSKDNLKDCIKIVVDKKKTGYFHGIPIQKEVTDEDGMLWIVTPSYQTQKIVNDLCSKLKNPEKVISLREWIKQIA